MKFLQKYFSPYEEKLQYVSVYSRKLFPNMRQFGLHIVTYNFTPAHYNNTTKNLT